MGLKSNLAKTQFESLVLEAGQPTRRNGSAEKSASNPFLKWGSRGSY